MKSWYRVSKDIDTKDGTMVRVWTTVFETDDYSLSEESVEWCREMLNDAVPVIRCKDCKHYQADDDGIYCDTLGIFGTSPTSYCSFAKRRDDER